MKQKNLPVNGFLPGTLTIIDKILEHYSKDFEITTPMITFVTDNKSDTLKGKKSVKAYWEQALEKVPDLQFELFEVFVVSIA